MLTWIRRHLNSWYVGPTILTIAILSWFMFIFGTIASLPVAAPDYRTGQECQARLNDPAPLSTTSRDFLQRCVSAFAVPATSSSTAPSSSTTQPATSSPPPPPTSLPQYPNQASTGVPQFWQPVTIRDGTWTITQSGTYQDVQVNGGINVAASNVTLRRVLVRGGAINNESGGCRTADPSARLLLDQVTVTSTGSTPLNVTNGAVTPGGYTARRVKLLNVVEGFRSGGGSVGCGPIHIEHSFAQIRGINCHCDGLQVYDGAGTYVDGLTIDWVVNVGTTAFFAPSGEARNGPVEVRHLLLKGGGWALTDHIPGFVEDYAYVRGSAAYGAMDVDCSIVNPFLARIVAIDSNFQVTSAQPLACGAGSGQ